MSGLVTTPALAASFSNGMEFFATFGEWVGPLHLCCGAGHLRGCCIVLREPLLLLQQHLPIS
jgi:hypothetical protein